MMIQSSNLISMLTGVENNTAIQGGLSSEINATIRFNTDFLQQLEMLQANSGKNADIDSSLLSELQGQAELQDSNAGGNSLAEDVQNFAALLGKTTITANKVKPEINLDDTLHALSDVLQTIQGLNTQPETTAQTQTGPGGENLLKSSNQDKAESLSMLEQQPDSATLSAVAAVILPAAIATPTPKREAAPPPISPTTLETPSSPKVQQAVINIDNQLAQQMQNPPMATNNPDTVLLKNKPDSGKTDKYFEPALASVQSDDKSSQAFNNLKLGDSSGWFNNNTASQNSEQNKSALPDVDDNNVQRIDKQINSAETDKFASRIGNEIAQLNQAVNTGAGADAPALAKPLGHPDWNNELGQKLIWMHKQDMPSAELRLNPEHLGPISVKIDVNQEHTTISFTAQHAEVKDAIEAAIPKLREMLGGQQMNLVDVNVSQQSDQKSANAFFQAAGGGQSQGRHPGQNPESSNPAPKSNMELADEVDAGRAAVSSGLLSLFA